MKNMFYPPHLCNTRGRVSAGRGGVCAGDGGGGDGGGGGPARDSSRRRYPRTRSNLKHATLSG